MDLMWYTSNQDWVSSMNSKIIAFHAGTPAGLSVAFLRGIKYGVMLYLDARAHALLVPYMASPTLYIRRTEM
jgi:hypothetical protein